MPVQVLLVVAYMLLTHCAVVFGSDRLALFAVTLLVLAMVVGPLRRGQRWPYAVVLACAAVVVIAGTAPWARIVLFLPPVLVNLGLAWLFGATLRRGEMPLIERIVRRLHERDDIEDPAVWTYARSVTACWTVLFVFNAAVCLGLALVATPRGLLATIGWPPPFTIPAAYWSVFSNFGCYLLTGILFVCEYQYRRRRFPWQPYRNFFDFTRRAIAIAPALLADLAARAASR